MVADGRLVTEKPRKSSVTPNVHGYSELGVTVILVFTKKFSLENGQRCKISRQGVPLCTL